MMQSDFARPCVMRRFEMGEGNGEEKQHHGAGEPRPCYGFEHHRNGRKDAKANGNDENRRVVETRSAGNNINDMKRDGN